MICINSISLLNNLLCFPIHSTLNSYPPICIYVHTVLWWILTFTKGCSKGSIKLEVETATQPLWPFHANKSTKKRVTKLTKVSDLTKGKVGCKYIREAKAKYAGVPLGCHLAFPCIVLWLKSVETIQAGLLMIQTFKE